MNKRLISAVPLLLAAATIAAAAPAVKKGATKPKPKPALPAKYKPIVTRNIFGFMPRKETAAATAPVKIDTPPVNPIPRANIDIPAVPAPSGPVFALTGIIQVNGGYRALIEDRTSGQGFYVSEGGEAGDFHATKIYATGAVLEKPGVRIVLNIGGSKAAVPAASPLPPSELIKKESSSRQWLPPSVAPRLGPKK